MSPLKSTSLVALMAIAPMMAPAQAFAQSQATTPVTTETAPADAAEPVEGLSIFFDIGSQSIRSDQQPTLNQAARLFRDGNPIVMIVSGSADTIGDAAENLDLSISRARMVADGLVARGIPIERLQILGRGNSELPVPTQDGVANEDNRSVLITWR